MTQQDRRCSAVHRPVELAFAAAHTEDQLDTGPKLASGTDGCVLSGDLINS